MKYILTLALLFFITTANSASPVVEIIVPFPPGGPTDSFARATQRYLEAATGKIYVVVNKPGADGRIAGKYASSKPADGSSMIIVGTAFMFNKVMYANPGYEFTDFDMVLPIAKTPMALMVPVNSKINNITDFIAAARYEKLNCGITNTGGQLAARALLYTIPDNNVELIPYKGGADLLTALMGEQISCAMDTMSSYKPAHLAKKIKIIALDDRQQHPDLANVSLISDRIKYYNFGSWFGVGILASTPGSVKDPLVALLATMKLNSDFQNSMYTINLDVVTRSTTVDESNSFIRQEYEKFELVRQQNKILKVN